MKNINSLDDIIRKEENLYLKHIVGDVEAADTEQAHQFYTENWAFLSDKEEDYGRIRREAFSRKPEDRKLAYKGTEIVCFAAFADILIRCDHSFREGLFSFPNANEKLKKLEIILCSENIPFEIKSRMAHLYHLSQTKANFIPLPSPEFYSGFNMEQQRSSSKFNNHCDRFMKAIEEQVDFEKISKMRVDTGDDQLDMKPLKEMEFEIESNDNFLTKMCNLRYFKKFESYSDYIEKNRLQDMFTDTACKDPICLSPSEKVDGFMPYKNHDSKKLTEEKTDAIYNEMAKALDNAINFIQKRSQRF